MDQQSADPKTVVNRQFNEVINARRLDLAGEVFDPKVQIKRMGMQGSVHYLLDLNGPTGEGALEQGPPEDPIAGFQHAFGILLKSFPDMQNVVGDQFVVDDVVISRIKFSGTHEGDFFGVPATNRKIEFDEVLFMKVANGKITEVWAIGDELTLLQELGVLESAGH